MPSSVEPPVRAGPAPLIRLRRVAVVAWMALPVLVGACDDAGTDPLEGLVAGDTDAAALALGLPLPSPDHEAIAGTDGPAGTALMDWRGSWDMPVPAGRSVRNPLYPLLARSLDQGMHRDDVIEALMRLDEGVRTAQSLPHENLPALVRDGIQRAAGSSAAAADAFRRHDHRRAIEYALRGSDALREVGPEAVARTVVTEVEELLRRIRGNDAYSEQDAIRISRLVRGSRRALDEEDWALAIRRAWYARGLLDPER